MSDDQAIQDRISELERRIEVEEALEHVRTRVMKMCSSDELSEVIAVIFHQLDRLGFDVDSCSINTWTEVKSDFQMWIAAGSRQQLRVMSIFVPATFWKFEHPGIRKALKAWEGGEHFYEEVHSKEEKDRIYMWLFEHTDLRHLPKDRKAYRLESPGLGRSTAVMEHGSVVIQNHKGLPFSGEENEILRRFGLVFEQTYTRFLDLKKAEEQAREAQIEAALERVRAHSMAMQHSDELAEVIAVIFDQLDGLRLNLHMCQIEIYEDRMREVQVWVSSAFRMKYTRPFYLPESIWDLEHPMMVRRNRALENGELFYTEVYSRAEMAPFYQWYYKHTDFRDIAEERKKQVMGSPGLARCNALMKHGALSAQNYTCEPFSEEENAIIRRFVRVFEQTYTRFLDLKKAEEQAREAVRQASVDRVRAEIASMRTATDLERITPLVWRELTRLGVPFFRCGVFIMDDETEAIQSFLTTPEGEHLVAFTVPYDVAGTTQAVVDHWRQDSVYTEVWSRQQFIDWSRMIFENDHILSDGQISAYDDPPESLSLHFVPFAQGMLYVGNDAPLSENQIDLAQSLADTFTVAYARYEDFKQLESKNAELATTLDNLKSTQQQLVQQEKLASLGQLTAGIAHEIKNPLNFVNNFSQLSVEALEELETLIEKTERQEDEEIREIIETLKLNGFKIHEHGRRADRIVASMMRHASGATGERQKMDLNAFVEEYVSLAQHSWQAETRRVSGEEMHLSSNATDTAGLIVTRDYDAAAGQVELVPQEIGQVLVNLFNNAFDAVMERGVRSEEQGEVFTPRIAVSTKRQDGVVEIRVSDNGPGIPEEVKDKILEPFFTTKPTGSGTGLGLSLSYDIVTQGHGGKLKIESEKGKGATFVVQLPLIP